MTRRTESGSAAVEMVMVAPVMMLLIATIVAAGRIVSTKTSLESVAREDARVASMSSSPVSAELAARLRADEVAEQLGLDKQLLRLEIQAGRFERGSSVTARASYDMRLGDLPAFGMLPGSFEISAKQFDIAERYGSR
jgi:hypothetical protein